MNQRTTLSVSITPELRKMVANEVASGRYPSASEVVRDALRRLKARNAREDGELARVRGKIARGLAEADRGDVVDGEAFFAALLARIDARPKKP